MPLAILESIILGIVQGITEWIPISSSAMISLILANFYNITDPATLIETALFFHLGTFFAALIYFRKEATQVFITLFNYKKSNEEEKKTFNFLFWSTLISGIIGIIILKLLSSVDLSLTGKTITLIIGLFLLFTGIIQIKIRYGSLRAVKDIKPNDSVVLGIAQGISTLPGISRSGITISSLLLKKFDDTTALKLSFLMSLPIVLIGNILLNLNSFYFSLAGLIGILVSFIFGLLTIHVLMKLSKKINFGWFVLVFAVLMLFSVLI